MVHVLIAFLVLVGLVFLSTVGWLAPILDAGRMVIQFLNYPFRQAVEGFTDFFAVAGHLKDLASQNQILTEQVEELTVSLAALEKAGLDNRILREALNFLSDSPLQLIPAEIVAADPLNPEQKVVVNRGAADGVSAGDAVIVSRGILVGVVSEAFEHSSNIELITSSRVAVNAQVLPSGATGIVRGEHGLGLLFDLVSQSETINTGDRIITSGLGGNFPKNLLIGEVGEIRTITSELFQKATVAPAANLRNLKVVFIAKRASSK